MKQYISLSVALLAITTTANAQSQTDSLALDSIYRQYELAEVSVKAQRKLVKTSIDRLTYDISRDEESRTKTTLEMLRKVPLVTVDGQDNIKVKGSSAFKIYRNGHPDPSLGSSNAKDILKSIPASMIKKIEVITDPGAREDAEGTTYILNIVMADNTKFGGVMGTATLGYEPYMGGTQAGAYVVTQMGKLATSVNYGMQDGKQDQTSHNVTRYRESGMQMVDQSVSSVPVTVHYGNINTSLDIDSLNLMTLSFGGYYYSVKVASDGQSETFNPDGSLMYRINSHFDTPTYDFYNLNGRYDYQHKTHLDGEVLTMSYMLSTTRYRQGTITSYHDLVNAPMNYTAIDRNNQERYAEHTAQLDYVRPLGSHWKWETGAKYIYRSNKSDVDARYVGAPEMNQLTKFDHRTQVAAAYMEGMWHLDKWSAQAGLRYEYSRLRADYPDHSGEGYHKTLSDWVPSASVRYAFNDADALKLSFATSINRPGISYLNPAVTEDYSSKNYGNPNLNSARNQNLGLEFGHTGRKITYNATLYYNFSNNQIASLNFTEGNLRVSTYGDALHEKELGVFGYVQWQPTLTTSVSLNQWVGRKMMKDYGAGLTLCDWAGNSSLNVSQQLPWKLRMSFTGYLDYGHDVMNVYGYSSHWNYWGLSLQRSFLKEDRLTVRIVAQNLIGPKYQHFKGGGNIQGDYTNENVFGRKSKQLGVTVSYRFGRIKAGVKSVDKSISNSDVVGGLSAGTSGSK